MSHLRVCLAKLPQERGRDGAVLTLGVKPGHVEGGGDPLVPRAAGAADAVHVAVKVVFGGGQVHVHHVLHARDVQPPGRHVRGHQHAAPTLAEFTQRRLALTLQGHKGYNTSARSASV
eukprot:3343635-Pyramimonas_sp.AAC.1